MQELRQEPSTAASGLSSIHAGCGASCDGAPAPTVFIGNPRPVRWSGLFYNLGRLLQTAGIAEMANGKPNVQRTPTQWRESLVEHVELLKFYCAAFDTGQAALAKPMSASLRLLLHTSPSPKSTSRALLDHFQLRRGRWFDVAGQLDPQQIPLNSRLVRLQLLSPSGAVGQQIKPSFGTDGSWLRQVIRTEFVGWWTAPVARGLKHAELSRMDLVREVADRDGGAHIDPSIGEQYAGVMDGSYSGLALWYGGARLAPGWHSAAIRAITHETLLSLHKYASWAFTSPYVWPNSLEPSKSFNTDTCWQELARYRLGY